MSPLLPLSACLDVPLKARTTPMLLDAIDCLFDLLASCQVSGVAALGVADAAGLFKRFGTLRAMVDAGWVDGHRIAAALAEVSSPGAEPRTPVDAVDRFFVPTILLGLSRLPLAPAAAVRTDDAWLRDVLASLIAVDAYRPLLVPDLAPEALSSGTGCHTDPRLGRAVIAGRWLASHVGFDVLVQAAAGKVALELPGKRGSADLLATARTLAVSGLLPEGLPREERGLGEQDTAWLEDAVYALCVRRRRVGGVPAASPEVPRGGGLRLGTSSSILSVLDPAAPPAPAAGEALDEEVLRLGLSPALCLTLERAGWSQMTVHFSHPNALDDLIDVIVDLCDARTPPQEIVGDGFALLPG